VVPRTHLSLPIPPIYSQAVSEMRIITVISPLVCIASLVTGKVDESKFNKADIIERDVAILGGGGSGANAAVLLKQDHRKSVVVIEMQGHLVCLKTTG
jgi:hypothetical protein